MLLLKTRGQETICQRTGVPRVLKASANRLFRSFLHSKTTVFAFLIFYEIRGVSLKLWTRFNFECQRRLRVSLSFCYYLLLLLFRYSHYFTTYVWTSKYRVRIFLVTFGILTIRERCWFFFGSNVTHIFVVLVLLLLTFCHLDYLNIETHNVDFYFNSASCFNKFF